MSLKSFHIAFIAISTLCAFGCAVWATMNFLSNGDAVFIAAAAGGAAAGIGLIIYGVRFLRKLKNVSFL